MDSKSAAKSAPVRVEGERPVGAEVGRGPARLRAGAALLALAALGALLWRLPAWPEAPVQVVAEAAEGLGCIALFAREGDAADARGWVVLLSRLPAALDPAGPILRVEGRPDRVVPPGARSVLVRADGRVEASSEPLLPAPILRALLEAPAGERLRRLKAIVEQDALPVANRFPAALKGFW